MWFDKLFDSSARDLVAKYGHENEALRDEVKNLKKVIDELLTHEHEQKAVYNYSLMEKEKIIAELEEKIASLQDVIDEIKLLSKRKKSS